MSRFWKRGRDSSLEHELRANRPQPSAEFLQNVGDRVRRDSSAPRRGAFRVALAGALTLSMLAGVAAFGGLGYAATGATQAAKAVKKIAAPPAPKAQASQKSAQSAKTESPSDNQYQSKQYVCHRTGSSKNPFVLIYVSSNAVPAHQGHGDVVFPPGTPRETAAAQCDAKAKKK